MARMTKAKQAEQAEAVARLRGWLKRGDTLYTICRSVSRSGMTRTIGLVQIEPCCSECGADVGENGACPHGCNARVRSIVRHPNHAAALALGRRLSTKGDDGVIVQGCGMDMGFHLVYTLSRLLFDGDGYALSHRWL